MRDFTLVALHTTPSQTVSELRSLAQVLQHVRGEWDTDNIIILGDLNADCSYLPQKDRPSIQLRHDPDLWWPIGDDVDTTVNSNTDCAYDRCVFVCVCVYVCVCVCVCVCVSFTVLLMWRIATQVLRGFCHFYFNPILTTQEIHGLCLLLLKYLQGVH